jgi:preprotein translocase subunit SecD
MQQTWPLRLLIAIGLLGAAAYFVVPTAIYFGLDEEATIEVRKSKGAFEQYVPSWAPKTHIVPGLDLQGGIHMVLGVDLQKALSDRASRSANRVRSTLEDKDIAFTAVDHLPEEGSGDRLKVVFADDKGAETFEGDLMADYFGDLAIVSRDGLEFVLRVHPDYAQQLKKEAVDQTIKTINNRIDKMGVTEPSIAKRGDDQVQIQLPGMDDPEEAKSLIGRTAQLEFFVNDDETEFLTELKDGLPEWAELQTSGYNKPGGGYGKDIFLVIPDTKMDEAKQFLAGKIPSGRVIKWGSWDVPVSPGEPKKIRSYSLMASVQLTGDDLVDARVNVPTAENPRPSVGLDFSPAGGKIFADLTRKNVGNRMAIVLEDTVDSAPVIQQEISGGSAQITMGGNKTSAEMRADARQLALVLKSGALPAPVQFREERSVGPSLGRDAVERGRTAFLAGGIFVLLFMLIYYQLGGLISAIGIFFNLMFIAAAMSWVGATITLPGLAGLLLTVGMAVDANIIILERIREELRGGKTPRSAVHTGYDHALSAIIDANVTTFIAGLVLFQFGTGPIQNFAVTLLIGTVSSVISAVFITRIFFDMLVSKGPETIRI